MKALLVLDFINDIVHPEGKLAKKGYASFIEEHNVIENLNKAIKQFRENNDPIVFVKVGFSKGYKEQPKNSPLFGKAHEFGVLEIGSRGTEIIDTIDYQNDFVTLKHRVSAFYQTDLDLFLRTNNISELYLAGCSTDLVVEATARDGHDRDYSITVLENCCAGANEDDHQRALETIKKIGKIHSV